MNTNFNDVRENYARAKGLIVGSGPEDIGRELSGAEQYSRVLADVEARREAERQARQERLDVDAVVYAALRLLVCQAEIESRSNVRDWLHGFVSYFTQGQLSASADVVALVDKAIASLSPVVRGQGR